MTTTEQQTTSPEHQSILDAAAKIVEEAASDLKHAAVRIASTRAKAEKVVRDTNIPLGVRVMELCSELSSLRSLRATRAGVFLSRQIEDAEVFVAGKIERITWERD